MRDVWALLPGTVWGEPDRLVPLATTVRGYSYRNRHGHVVRVRQHTRRGRPGHRLPDAGGDRVSPAMTPVPQEEGIPKTARRQVDKDHYDILVNGQVVGHTAREGKSWRAQRPDGTVIGSYPTHGKAQLEVARAHVAGPSSPEAPLKPKPAPEPKPAPKPAPEGIDPEDITRSVHVAPFKLYGKHPKLERYDHQGQVLGWGAKGKQGFHVWTADGQDLGYHKGEGQALGHLPGVAPTSAKLAAAVQTRQGYRAAKPDIGSVDPALMPPTWDAADRQQQLDRVLADLGPADRAALAPILGDMYDRTPAVFRKLKAVYSLNAAEMKKRGVKGSRAEGAYWQVSLQHGQTIAIRKELYGKRGQEPQRYDSGWRVNGDRANRLEGVLAHEYGHHVATMMGHGRKQVLLELLDRPADLEDASVSTIWYANAKDQSKSFRARVSKYGASNVQEVYAEVWAAYATMSQPPAHIVRAGRLMELAANGQLSPTADRSVRPDYPPSTVGGSS